MDHSSAFESRSRENLVVRPTPCLDEEEARDPPPPTVANGLRLNRVSSYCSCRRDDEFGVQASPASMIALYKAPMVGYSFPVVLTGRAPLRALM